MLYKRRHNTSARGPNHFPTGTRDWKFLLIPIFKRKLEQNPSSLNREEGLLFSSLFVWQLTCFDERGLLRQRKGLPNQLSTSTKQNLFHYTHKEFDKRKLNDNSVLFVWPFLSLPIYNMIKKSDLVLFYQDFFQVFFLCSGLADCHQTVIS